jgi:transcriptional regulator with XRE-family HTH domain
VFDIHALHGAKQLKQSDLATILNKAMSTVSRYEKGETDISIHELLTIAEALDTTASKILDAWAAGISKAKALEIIVTKEDLQVAIANHQDEQAIPLVGKMLSGVLGQSICLVDG